MAGSPSHRRLRQVHRLFNYGAIGTMSDARLVEWFVSRRDETAEAAFEELVIRHGPMVLRVCRGVLQDAHDAEDAFQAVFLVLANRARSIRRGEASASWLFGVAHHVAARARRSAARRRRLDQLVAYRNPESYVPAANDPDWEILHEEIDGLPERLRGPVVLCYLEGLTYEAAAQHLGLSEVTVRGRLARARERLRRGLTRRGVTMHAGLMAAGLSTQSQAAVPGTLVHSTIRIAFGFMSGNSAAILARGVLNSMLLNQLKVAAVLVLLAVGSGYAVWHAVASAIDDNSQGPGHAPSSQIVDKKAVASPVPQPKAPPSTYRLTGMVKVEGTNKLVAGARLQIVIGNTWVGESLNEKVVETGTDGRFAADLPAGNIQVWLSDPPAGYVVSSARDAIQELIAGPNQPLRDREFRVRKGTIWNFRFIRGSDQKPFPGFVASTPAATAHEQYRAQADDRGQAQLTLPTERREVNLAVREASPAWTGLQTGMLAISLEWEANFLPDALDEIVSLEGNGRRFRLTDVDAKSAVLQAPDTIEPVKEDGKLVIRVAVPHRDAKDFAALTGLVLAEQGQPIAGAQVAVSTFGTRVSSELRHQATTDRQGRYRLRDIPRRGIDGKPLRARLLVTKEGYGGFGMPTPSLNEGDPEKPLVVDAIKLDRSVSLSGVVVDHHGQPVTQAWVRSIQPVLRAGSSGTPQSVKTDGNGRFTFRDLRRGVTQVSVVYGKNFASGAYFVDGSPDEARLKLPESFQPVGPNPAALLDGPAAPIAAGQTAVEWQVGPWSDGRTRKLSDSRGKVVVLYFWGISFWQSVSAMPALGKLATEFQPRGVDFMAIHNAEPDEARAQKQGRKLLAFQGVRIALAIDQTRIPKHARGMTAQLYGASGYPVVIVIDRAGKIAYRSDTATGAPNMTTLFRQMVENPKTITEEKVNESVGQALADEIEKALK